MTQYLVMRQQQEGVAHLLGITEDTALTERQVADQWATERNLDDTLRLHFVDVTKIKTIDVTPVVTRKANTVVVPPDQAFVDPPIIDVEEAPVP